MRALRAGIFALVACAACLGPASCALVVRPGVGPRDAALPYDTATDLPASDAATDDTSDVATDVPTIIVESGCLPPCVADLFRACLPAGACVSQSTWGVARKCYANGVGYATSYNSDNAPVFDRVTRDGGVCRTTSIEYLTRPGSGDPTVVIRHADGAGRLVATYHPATASMPATVQCGGQRFLVDLGSPDCREFDRPAGCVTGPCMP